MSCFKKTIYPKIHTLPHPSLHKNTHSKKKFVFLHIPTKITFDGVRSNWNLRKKSVFFAKGRELKKNENIKKKLQARKKQNIHVVIGLIINIVCACVLYVISPDIFCCCCCLFVPGAEKKLARKNKQMGNKWNLHFNLIYIFYCACEYVCVCLHCKKQNKTKIMKGKTSKKEENKESSRHSLLISKTSGDIMIEFCCFFFYSSNWRQNNNNNNNNNNIKPQNVIPEFCSIIYHRHILSSS